MIDFTAESFARYAAKHAPGFAEAARAQCHEEMGRVRCPAETLEELRRRFPMLRAAAPREQHGPVPPESPTAAELAANFAGAMRRWVAGGFTTASEADYRERQATCAACEKWEPRAYAGLGKCRACGCTSLKLWLATERCPVGKWRETGPAGRLQTAWREPAKPAITPP